ncbi:MAG TPA: hypothetical protein VFG50_02730 [Rhodothermales bacterium]|nr:hypothetical protein [Rhodothermales bacterium]
MGMDGAHDRSLNDLIASVRELNIVDSISKRGRNVTFSAGGEQFTLSQKWAFEFLDALLRISSVYPDPERPDHGDTDSGGNTPSKLSHLPKRDAHSIPVKSP